jgi:hypothetical protein
MDQVYPSTREIIPDLLLHKLPVSLVNQIEERYNLLGPKYVTEEVHLDGRFINGCMLKSSAQDAIEEVIDAVFNVLVLIFKNSKLGPVIPDELYSVLSGLIEIYTALCVIREMNR